MSTRHTLAIVGAMAAAGHAAAQQLVAVPADPPRVVSALPPAPSYAVPAQPAYQAPAAPGYAPLPPPGAALPPEFVPAPAMGAPAFPVVPVYQQTLTLTDALRSLKGLPAGQHQIHFIHPVTNRPVCVSVRLRDCVHEVKWHKFLGQHRLALKVRGFANDVIVKFNKNGSVVVDG